LERLCAQGTIEEALRRFTTAEKLDGANKCRPPPFPCSLQPKWERARVGQG
jgi:hypothetical protein